MDGFYTTGGINTLGYYTGQDIPYYYSLITLKLIGRPGRPGPRTVAMSGTRGGDPGAGADVEPVGPQRRLGAPT
jgi:hypothetical protein